MNCPKCTTPLSIGERKGVEIDYCQTCRGVWLDAGELDKIVDRSGKYHDSHGGRREEKNESWWERVVDIFD